LARPEIQTRDASRIRPRPFEECADHMQRYEHTLIARQDLSPQQAQALAETYSGVLTEHGAEVTKTEYWGLRNLSYRIKKNRKGHYLHLNVRAPADAITELERQERLSDDVLRYLTVKVDELEEGPSVVMQSRSSREDRPRRPHDDGDRPRRAHDDDERPRRAREDEERPRRPRDEGARRGHGTEEAEPSAEAAPTAEERPRRAREDEERPRRPRDDGAKRGQGAEETEQSAEAATAAEDES
jgi:small subunit ribosomal protein S6